MNKFHKTNISTFHDNNYRIGEAILNQSGDVYKYVNNNKKYHDSFLQLFINKVNDYQKKHNIIIPTYDVNCRINIAFETVNDILKQKHFDIPDKDTLVVHLRLGDIFNFPLSSNQQIDLFSSKRTIHMKQKFEENIIKSRLYNVNDVIEQIKKSKKSKLTIVTAFHHQLYNRSNILGKLQKTNNSNINSIKLLNEIISKIPDYFDISIRSSENIDDDFIYLCKADELILSSTKSSFGLYADKIRTIYQTGKLLPDTPPPPAKNPIKYNFSM